MECIICGHPMKLMSYRQKPRSGEMEEQQWICECCGHYVVRRADGAQTWYDKNDKPIHPTHDK